MASLDISNVKTIKQIINYSLIRLVNNNNETIRVYKGKSGNVLSPQYGYLEQKTTSGIELEIYNLEQSYIFQNNYLNILQH